MMAKEKEFLEAVNEHRLIIHKICNLYLDNPQDRNDLFQEILLAAWKGYANFRNESKFSTWLYRVALNTAVTFYRKGTRHIRTMAYTAAAGQVAGEEENNSDRSHALQAAINMLTGVEKAIVMLYMDSFSHTEIARITGITENHVAVKLSRIKIKLKSITKRFL